MTEKEEIKEGILKNIKRGMQGWGNGTTPAGIKARASEYTDDEVSGLSKSYDDLRKTRATLPTSTDVPKHSPAGLQKRVLDREMKKRNLTKESEELDEVSAAAMGHAAEREYATNGAAKSSIPSKTKYIVKHKTTGKVLSTHTNAPDAVRARNKAGAQDTHSIIKEEFDIMEQVKELINAMESGKSLDIESSFNEIMASKLSSAIDNRRQEIAANLFTTQESADSVEEAVGEPKKNEWVVYHRGTSIEHEQLQSFATGHTRDEAHKDAIKRNPAMKDVPKHHLLFTRNGKFVHE